MTTEELKQTPEIERKEKPKLLKLITPTRIQEKQQSTSITTKVLTKIENATLQKILNNLSEDEKSKLSYYFLDSLLSSRKV